jgi:hypothetical protein
MIYPGIRTANNKQELDRGTWAVPERVENVHDLFLSPEVIELEISFKLAFEGQPFFQLGVELQEGEVLIEGDYPAVSAGVKEWRTTNDGIEEPEKAPYYIGALVWVQGIAATAYRIRYRTYFEGTSFKNPTLLGTNAIV